ncbi:MAG: ATPase, T2SS/T4P/T4SS family [Candidatus Verstraetearchaeota archaeon]|nr:ATPase, T2SS/T4P/T4SS family [Candidatus Verstraetearchaeota archaeon]
MSEVVPDISSINSGFIADLVSAGKIGKSIIIPRAVLSSIRKSSERGDLIPLEELEKLKNCADSVGIKVEVEGWDRSGEDPDESVLRLAMEKGYTIVTSNENLAKTAEAVGLAVIKGRTRITGEPLFLKFFDKETMSVHLKEGVQPRAKIGRPGRWKLVELGGDPMGKTELEKIVQDIHERAEAGEGFLEVKREGSHILMLKDSRVIVTFPPFSDRLEVTITRKVAELEIEDYNLPEKLLNRFKERAEGILISGAPGMGKTTFAQALAKFYLRQNKIIKTIESPRDLSLPKLATEYSKTHSTSEELHDVLLLSRPDYTFFDEMRDTEDFKIFTDLRLAGVGMVGVIHATSPIDSIQRFIGRVELGVIPSVIDTVVFINNGNVEKVYDLETSVKIPHGLTESDLTRPVVLVRNFLDGEVEYELYVFGERTFVVPVKHKERKGTPPLKPVIARILGKYIDMDEVDIEVGDGEVRVMVPPERISIVARRTRKKLQKIEEKLGSKILLKPKY